MQVQRIQQSPSFGMALKPKCSRKALESLDDNILKTLRVAKEELANTKVDLELVGENAEPRIVTPYAVYRGDFEPIIDEDTKYLKYLRIRTIVDSPKKYELAGKKEVLSVKMPSAVVAEKAYEDMQKAQNKYERAVEFTKILDDYFILYNKKNVLEKVETQTKDELISDILGA